MKAKEISMEIVHNLGNYESVRLSMTCELAPDEEADFKAIQAHLEKQYKKIYHKSTNVAETPKNTAKKDTVPNLPKLEYSEVQGSVFMRVVEAIKQGRITADKVCNYYTITEEVYNKLKEYAENKTNKKRV